MQGVGGEGKKGKGKGGKDTLSSSGGWYVEKSTKYTVDLALRKYINRIKVKRDGEK